MASLNDIVIGMQSAQLYLFRYGCPILMLIGIVSCIMNLSVFTQKNLRKNPCSIYFIAYNVANFVFICSLLLPMTLEVGYSIDLSAHNLSLCHLRLYISILFDCLSPFYLILASIDRILITSPNALTRRKSTLRLAYICIASGTLFWALFHIHALIFGTILQLGPIYFVCYYQLGVYFSFMGYYSVIKETVALALMIICGLWAIKNVRRMGRVGVVTELSLSRTVVETNSRSTSSKDRQLVLILLMDITIYGLFSFLYAIFLMYQIITANHIKSLQQQAIEGVITNLCLFSLGVPFCTSFYANLIISKTFRKELKKVLSWKRIFCIE
jgi:hypothetical protein